MGSIRVAIVGVGNCASSLVQGVEYYKDADPAGNVPGLMHVRFGKYHVNDVEFVAAFDVDAKKVGFDLSEASAASENNTIKFADVPPTGVIVQRGHTLDGIGKYYGLTIEESDATPVDVVAMLRDVKADVLVSYLPVGSEVADKFYAQCAIDAGVAFVNALPVFIASDPEWAAKFEAAGVPIIGDDIKSQVGATITHRVLAKLFEDRGVVLDRTYQLSVGGNMDFRTCSNAGDLGVKKISKTGGDLEPHRTARREDRRPQRLSARPLWPGSMTANGPTFALVGRSAMCRQPRYKLEVWDSRQRRHHRDAIRAARSPGPRHRWRPAVGQFLPDEVPAGQREDTEGAPASRASSPARRVKHRLAARPVASRSGTTSVGQQGLPTWQPNGEWAAYRWKPQRVCRPLAVRPLTRGRGSGRFRSTSCRASCRASRAILGDPGRRGRTDQGTMYPASAVSTLSVTLAVPPRTTMRFGCKRTSSAAIEAGMALVSTRSIGPLVMPATGAPESASAKTRPEAT